MRSARLVAGMLCLAAAAGCATAPEDRPVLRYGIGESAETRRLVWPPVKDDEVPRYLYAGQLTGEENFQARKKEDETPGLGDLLRWLAGVIVGEAAPVVLQRPQSGITDEAGRILVTDMSRQAVFVFDEQAGRLDVWDKAEGQFNFVSPAGIVLAPDGQVWVADAELGFIARLDRRGNTLPGLGRGQLIRPTGLALDAAGGRLYVADTHGHDIKVFGLDGRLLATLGRRGDGPGEFSYPTHLAFARGRLYVADTMNARVQVLDAATGRPLRSIGDRGMYVGNLVRPKGVATDSEGNVYVVESYHDHLLVFNERGEFLMPIGGLGKEIGQFYLPAGVWTDARNRVFVADMFNGRIAVFQFLGGGSESGGE